MPFSSLSDFCSHFKSLLSLFSRMYISLIALSVFCDSRFCMTDVLVSRSRCYSFFLKWNLKKKSWAKAVKADPSIFSYVPSFLKNDDSVPHPITWVQARNLKDFICISPKDIGYFLISFMLLTKEWFVFFITLVHTYIYMRDHPALVIESTGLLKMEAWLDGSMMFSPLRKLISVVWEHCWRK